MDTGISIIDTTLTLRSLSCSKLYFVLPLDGSGIRAFTMLVNGLTITIANETSYSNIFLWSVLEQP